MPFRSITQAIERLCARHTIEPFTPRDLRRTCTTHWARIGLDFSAIGDLEHWLAQP